MKTLRNTLAGLALITSLILLSSSTASAQRAGSWVDIGRGFAGAGASADGDFQFAKSRSSNKNGIGFGHGFAVGAGPNGIAISNSIGAGGGPLGAAHNMQLNIGAGGTHLSHGGVVSQGGNRRVISGGSTGVTNGQVWGGSQSTGFGNNSRAYSKSHTQQFFGGAVPSSYPQGVQTMNQGTMNQGQFIRRGAPVGRIIFHR